MRTKLPRAEAPLTTCLLLVAAAPLAAQESDSSGTVTGDTVVVTARRLASEIDAERKLTPGNVTTVDGEDLYQRSVTNLADVLRYVPGMWSESVSGSDEIFFSSRGSNLDATSYDKNGIKLLQDGLPVTAADGNNHNRALDPLSAALRDGGAWRECAHLWRQHAGRRHRLQLADGPQQRCPVAVGAGRQSRPAQRAPGRWLRRRQLRCAGLGGVSRLGRLSRHSEQQTRAVYANAGWRLSEAFTARLFVTAVDSDAKLPGALTRAEVEENPDQASPAAADANYGKQVDTRRAALKTTWNINATSALDVGVSYEKQSLYHPIVERIMVDFDGAGPNPPVEVFSLLVDTDHRDTGASARYRSEVGNHKLLFGANFGDSTVSGGNYRNLQGQRNGLTEYVDNAADSLELFRSRSLEPERALGAGVRGQWVNAQPRRAHHRRRVRRDPQSQG
jgi:iron complex outermembrane receptor protein